VEVTSGDSVVIPVTLFNRNPKNLSSVFSVEVSEDSGFAVGEYEEMERKRGEGEERGEES
jgi:hypothetical protein